MGPMEEGIGSPKLVGGKVVGVRLRWLQDW
jgi:hypothetical protein